MKFTDSLRNNYEFRRLYSKGASAATPRMVVYCRRNRLPVNRLGLTVSNKIGKAVVRNRIRRRFREIYRLNEGALASGYDIVIVARRRSASALYGELESDFMRLAKKLGFGDSGV